MMDGMGNMDGMGMGMCMLLGTLLFLLVLGLVAAGIVWLVRRSQGRQPVRQTAAEELLERRYAAGELDEDEFRRRWSTLHP